MIRKSLIEIVTGASSLYFIIRYVIIRKQRRSCMKKQLPLILMCLFFLSGCTLNKTNSDRMMVMDKNNLYALADTNGKKYTDYTYKDYQRVNEAGYIVTNTDNKQGFINDKGKNIIQAGMYSYLNGSYALITASSFRKQSFTFKETQVILKEENAKQLELNDQQQAAYSSSNTKAVTVDKDGKVTAVGKGTAVIKASREGYYTSCQITVEPLKPVLNKTELNLYVNDESDLNISDKGNREVKWSVSDQNIVSVENGKVKALQKGSTDIIVSVGNDTLKCHVTVNEKKVSFNKERLTLLTDDSETIVINNKREDANIKWSSSHNDVAGVDQQGRITGLKPGTSTISASLMSQTLKCQVTVEKRVLSLSDQKLTLYKDDKKTLKINHIKANSQVTWSSSNNKVISVNQGTIEALQTGTAVITAVVDDQTLTCQVTVKEKKISLNKEDLLLMEKDTFSLSLQNSHDDIQWSSSHEKIASVDNKGVVTALSAGDTVISAKANHKIYKCYLSVKERTYGLSSYKMILTEDDQTNLSVKNRIVGINIQYESMNPDIVSIDNNGQMKALKKGTAYIKVTVEDNVYRCKVKVKRKIMKLSSENLSIYTGEHASIKLENAGNREISWQSQNKTVADVKNGTINGISSGKTVIIASIGDREYYCNVIVEDKKVVLSDTALTLMKGQTHQLKADNTYNKTVVYSSLDERVASVDEKGLIKANSSGKTEIQVTVGKKVYSCYLTVKRDRNKIIHTRNNPVYRKGVIIYKNNGKVFKKAGDNVGIKLTSLPVIIEKGISYVYYDQDTVLYKGTDEVCDVLVSKDSKQVALVFADHIQAYYMDGRKYSELSIKTEGNYQMMTSNDRYIVLYDKENQNLVYFDLERKKSISIEASITHASITDNHILLTNGDAHMIFDDYLHLVTVNSYYRDASLYIERNENVVYGPHYIVSKGKRIPLKDIQLYPDIAYLHAEVFPGYIKNKGFAYYNIEGKKAFDKIYLEAEAFDENQRAIVLNKNKTYSLIDTHGEEIIKGDIGQIKYLGNQYYAVFDKSGIFKVYDKDGKQVLDNTFTDLNQNSMIKYHDKIYLTLNKNGRSYLYDMSSYKVIFDIEGTIELKDGYFRANLVNYTMNGEKIK